MGNRTLPIHLMRWSLLAATAAALPMPAHAGPKNPAVISGSATFVQKAHELDIIQTTAKLQINWQDFSITKGETVKFIQPDKSSIALNRVIGGFRSDIPGRQSTNGQVWIINPKGEFFVPAKPCVPQVPPVPPQVLVPYTPPPVDVLSAKLFRSQGAQGVVAKVIDLTKGTNTSVSGHRVTVTDAGLAAFVAPGGINQGMITAGVAQVSLASGKALVVDLYGDQKINLAIDPETATKLFGDQGNLSDVSSKAGGQAFVSNGSVVLPAAIAKDLVDSVISLGSVVQAQSVHQSNGELVLMGDGGLVQVGALPDAPSKP